MARARALGGFLKVTRGVDYRRHTSASQKDKDRLERELRVWKLRGCLWMASMLFTSTAYASGTLYGALHMHSFTDTVISGLQSTPSHCASVDTIFFAVSGSPVYFLDSLGSNLFLLP